MSQWERPGRLRHGHLLVTMRAHGWDDKVYGDPGRLVDGFGGIMQVNNEDGCAPRLVDQVPCEVNDW